MIFHLFGLTQNNEYMVQSSTKGETYMTKFEFNLPMEELEMRTDKDHLMTKKMLKCDAPEYLEIGRAHV